MGDTVSTRKIKDYSNKFAKLRRDLDTAIGLDTNKDKHDMSASEICFPKAHLSNVFLMQSCSDSLRCYWSLLRQKRRACRSDPGASKGPGRNT